MGSWVHRHTPLNFHFSTILMKIITIKTYRGILAKNEAHILIYQERAWGCDVQNISSHTRVVGARPKKWGGEGGRIQWVIYKNKYFQRFPRIKGHLLKTMARYEGDRVTQWGAAPIGVGHDFSISPLAPPLPKLPFFPILFHFLVWDGPFKKKTQSYLTNSYNIWHKMWQVIGKVKVINDW